MNEHEEHLIALAYELRRGLLDMIRRKVLSADNCPDDFQWLTKTLLETEKTIREVEAHNDD